MPTIRQLTLSALPAGAYPGGAGVPWCRSMVPARRGACLLLFLTAGPYEPTSLAAFETAKLTAADGAPGDWFGRSVAISEDGNTVVVGSYRDDGHGSAYVFVRSGGNWIQQAKLTASDGAGNDVFGFSVAVSGDTVVVGALWDDIGPNFNQGSAFVFVKPAGGWTDMTQTAKLTASDGAFGDQFGIAVAAFGDTVVVGANGGGIVPNIPQGSTYVFVKPGGGWSNMTQTAELTASDGAASHDFGYSVAVFGGTVVVGASHALVTGTGSAYVFVKPGGGWANMTQTAKLTASDGGEIDRFGESVAVIEDTVVVGAWLDTIGKNVEQGSVYVFVKPGSGWADMTQTAKLIASDGVTVDHLGAAVAVSGDTVVAGAPSYFGSNSTQGFAYVFVKPGSGWADMTQTAKLTASDGASNDAFGISVGVSGDTVVVGAYHDNYVGSTGSEGSSYVYYIGPVEPPLTAPAPHDRTKNRYISFVPNNPGALGVSFRVRGSSAVPPVITDIGWVGAPDAQGNSQVVADPVTREWSEAVVHVGDCEIIPVAAYEIRGTMDGEAFTAPLTVSTIALPSLNNKLWGDVAGMNNGIEWTPPNQFTNVNDILAVLAYINGAAIKPTFQVVNLQAVSSADPCLNAFVNTADVLIAVKAVAGDEYPFTTNPASCPVCP